MAHGAATRWFASKGWKPLAFQRAVWNAYLAGESGLIHAATGTGKTLAAWWGPLLEAMEEEPGRGPRPFRVLWLTPLRALAADTRAALALPVNDLDLRWTVETRTGDTSSSTRARQGRRLPSALITTPESLSLLLPAFGEFTGCAEVEPASGDRIWVVAGGEVIAMPEEK